MTKRFKRLLCYCLLVMKTTIGIMTIRYYSISQHLYVHAIDNYLSESTAQNIEQFVHEQLAKKPSLTHMAKALKEQFNYLDTIAIHHKMPGIAYASISSCKPLLRINNELVLTNNGLITDGTIFSESPRVNLKVIDHANINNQIEHFIAAINNFHPTIWTDYYIEWHDHAAVYLYDSHESNFCILAHAEMLIDQKLLTFLSSVKKILNKKKSKNQRGWIADVRFKNQIIVSPHLSNINSNALHEQGLDLTKKEVL